VFLFDKYFYLVKEYEIVKSEHVFTEDEALKMGIEEIHEKLNINGIKNSDIITEKSVFGNPMGRTDGYKE